MLALFIRDIKLGFRAGAGALTGVIFFLSVMATMPFGLGSHPSVLAQTSSSLFWIATLLSTLFGLEKLFREDQEDGSLDSIRLSCDFHSLILCVFIKCCAFWVTNVLPILVLIPFIGFVLSLDAIEIFIIWIPLLVGTPAIVFIGAVGAAASIAFSRSGFLIFVLILPFVIPVLIFGLSSSSSFFSAEAAPFFTPFLMLCALTLFFGVLGSFSAALILQEFSE